MPRKGEGTARNPMEALLLAAGASNTVPDEFEVWPENWEAWRLYLRVATQWRVGTGGVVGLDYCAVYPLLDRMDLTAAEWDELLESLQVIELAAREAIQGNSDD